MQKILPLLAIMLSISGAAPVPTKQANYAGVWVGKVGNLPMRMCLFDYGAYGSEALGSGSYYYEKQLKLLRLQQLDANSWAENLGGDIRASDPRWHFDKPSAEVLTGQWIGGGKKLSVRLKRVADISTDGTGAQHCASDSYAALLLTPLTVREEEAEFDGVSYRRLIYRAGEHLDVEYESLALKGEGPALKKVNGALSLGMDGQSRINGYRECVLGALSAHGDTGAYGVVRSPVMITKSWLSIRDNEGGYCGGAHPFSESVSRTFDLRSGDEIKLIDWFGSNAFHRDQSPDAVDGAIEPAFRNVLMQRLPVDDDYAECREIVARSDYWDIGVRRDGVSFTPLLPHVAQACGDPIIVPYAELAPWLNGTGKAGLASVETSLRQAVS